MANNNVYYIKSHDGILVKRLRDFNVKTSDSNNTTDCTKFLYLFVSEPGLNLIANFTIHFRNSDKKLHLESGFCIYWGPDRELRVYSSILYFVGVNKLQCIVEI